MTKKETSWFADFVNNTLKGKKPEPEVVRFKVLALLVPTFPGQDTATEF